MNEYTASNGYRVELNNGAGYVCNVAGHERHVFGRYSIEAMREFFRAERDEELGRWRSSAFTDYVVYSQGDGCIQVVNETNGFGSGLIAQEEVWSYTGNTHQVAAAYFEAHPERKPWHDAKPGEVWVLKEHGQPERAYLVDDSQFYDSSRDYALDFGDSVILEARRIWPESDG